MSELTRRQFLKVTGMSLVGSSLAMMGSRRPALRRLREYKLTRATETRNTCPYCSVAAAFSCTVSATRQRMRSRASSI